MSLDDVLIAVIVGGIGLSGAYFRGEYILWRKDRAAELRKSRNTLAIHRPVHADCHAEGQNLAARHIKDRDQIQKTACHRQNR
jgi:hypothetical protein